jgi:hypothetical protein
MSDSKGSDFKTSETPSLIMIQFLAWVADRPRTYRQTMEAWRTSCPRLSVWEDAVIDSLVRIGNDADRAVRLTARGRVVLERAQAQNRPAEAKTPTRPKAKPGVADSTSTPRRRAAAEHRTY